MSSPTPRWPAVRAAFDACAEAHPAAWPGLIAAAGLNDAEAAQVRALLQHHSDEASAAAFLSGGAADALAADAAPSPGTPAASAPPVVRAGERLGAWEVVGPLGSGGMGEVFEARRADGQYQARAAVKLLKRGMDSAAVLSRFAQERQALAHLSHPHIARLLDAGASAEGLPYFVMEYVEGRPIHEAALAQPLNDRLQLFLQLADAVSHAHRHLLVHRDLKPGNVLVDAAGQVKLLDFGIAKALDPLESSPGADSTATSGGQRPFTPHYASPEQVRGERVTTATDIYSLGVLLYLMLTGARPTGRQAITPHDAARSVLEDEPTRPSRLSAAEALDPQWPQTRQRLQGDLDNILLKSLEKSAALRYASVDAMAADVTAFLEGRPVSARPASAGYLAAKFVRRHRWAVLAAALGAGGMVLGVAAAVLQERPLAAIGVVGLALGLALALVQARSAALSRDLAQAHLLRARAIARDVVERHAQAIQYLPGGAALQARLLGDLIEHLQSLWRQSETDLVLAAELACTHARLAHQQADPSLLARQEFSAADEHAAHALRLFERCASVLRPEQHIWWARAWRARAAAARARQALDPALEAAQRMADVLQRALQQHPRDTVLRAELGSAHFLRGQLLFAWGLASLQRTAEADTAYAQAAAVYEALLAEGGSGFEERHQLATAQGARMMVAFTQGDTRTAISLGEQALATRERNLAEQPDHVAMRSALVSEALNLSYVLMGSGHPERALAHADQGLSHLQALAHADPAHAAWAHAQVRAGLHRARPLVALGRAREALPLLEALADRDAPAERTGGPHRAAWARVELADAWCSLDDRVRAREVLAGAPEHLEAAARAAPDDALLRGLRLRAQAVQERCQAT